MGCITTSGGIFQSQHGAILTIYYHLLHSSACIVFQSQHGAILTWLTFHNRNCFVFLFQSQHGAILTSLCRGATGMLVLKISIPTWCDSNFSKNRFTVYVSSISIPTWCDSNTTLSDTITECLNAISIPTWCDSNHLIDSQSYWKKRIFQSQHGAILTKHSFFGCAVP